MLLHPLIAASIAISPLISPAATPGQFPEPAPCPYQGPHTTPPGGGGGTAHLQCLLRYVWGYTEVVVDGIAGPATLKAVIAHQIDCDVPADGVVGPQTWRLLHPESSTPECLDA